MYFVKQDQEKISLHLESLGFTWVEYLEFGLVNFGGVSYRKNVLNDGGVWWRIIGDYQAEVVSN